MHKAIEHYTRSLPPTHQINSLIVGISYCIEVAYREDANDTFLKDLMIKLNSLRPQGRQKAVYQWIK
jgi:hypothetical protein